LFGLKKSGKSSILKVVFNKMSPNETLFLETTTSIAREEISSSSFVQFEIVEFPGQINWFEDAAMDSESVFRGSAALVFVIDAQDEYVEALARLQTTLASAYRINPNLSFEIFIHKVDGLSDEHKIETTRDIHMRVSENLMHAGLEEVHVSFYLTSIYDHTIFESFSKVVQKLIRQLPTLENLLNILNLNSGFDKSFLFDVTSKIYIATDSAPVDVQSYELCSDMIDVVLDVSSIYGKVDKTAQSYDPFGDRPKTKVAFSKDSASIIKLSSGFTLCLKGLTEHLALVCIMRQDEVVRQGILEYNFLCFRKAIQEVFEVKAPHHSSGRM